MRNVVITFPQFGEECACVCFPQSSYIRSDPWERFTTFFLANQTIITVLSSTLVWRGLTLQWEVEHPSASLHFGWLSCRWSTICNFCSCPSSEDALWKSFWHGGSAKQRTKETFFSSSPGPTSSLTVFFSQIYIWHRGKNLLFSSQKCHRVPALKDNCTLSKYLAQIWPRGVFFLNLDCSESATLSFPTCLLQVWTSTLSLAAKLIIRRGSPPPERHTSTSRVNLHLLGAVLHSKAL